MNIPLEWLSDYVDLPAEQKILTDRLTAIGHMLDKTVETAGHPVIDLELRGNRADMFGLIGVARDISAAFSSPLRLPKIAPLPDTDPATSLLSVTPDAYSLITRFTGLCLSVKVGPSPDFIAARLAQYGIPSINNVVDITNYVMVETGEPMHAFDLDKLSGGHLVLRRAEPGEKFLTIQQGQELSLTSDDLVIADDSAPASLNLIGGFSTRVNRDTTNILLEAAVYNSGNVRRSSRRLKIFTEGGNRHAKHLDPENVIFALRRAVFLLKHYASAKVTTGVSDYYPHPDLIKQIDFPASDVLRLSGLDVPSTESSAILDRLGFKIKKISSNRFLVAVPSYRTDIEGSADLVEEIVRIYGYDKIPSTPITGPMPLPDNYPSYVIQDRIRDILLALGLDEVVTLSLISNNTEKYSDQTPVTIVNPPDPDMATLRPSMLPNLIGYTRHQLNQNQPRSSIFEIGKTFYQKDDIYIEELHLGISLGGDTLPPNWVESPRAFVYADLKGIFDRLTVLLGLPLSYKTGVLDNVYYAEMNLEPLINLVGTPVNPYIIASGFPPIVEDFNIVSRLSYLELSDKIRSLSPLITQISLLDNYQGKLTLRIRFHNPDRQLSSEDISILRKQILKIT